MKNKLRKPRYCQWREGWGNNFYSAQFPCESKPMFEVQQHGVTVAWVCPKHSIAVTQLGFQIR